MLSSSDAAYLLEAGRKSILPVTIAGEVNSELPVFSQFNNELFEKAIKSKISLDKLSSYTSFKKELNIESLFYNHLASFDGKEYAVVFISSNPGHYSDIQSKEFAIYLETLKEAVEAFYNSENERMFHIDLPVVITNRDGTLANVNNEAKKLFCVDAPGCFKESVVFYDKDDNEVAFEELPFMLAVKKKKKILYTKLKMNYKDESGTKELWFKVNSVPRYDDSGEVDKVLTSFWNITGKLDYEDWFEETAKNIQSVLYSSDLEGKRIDYVKEAAMKIFGCSKSDLTGNSKSLLRRISPEDFPRFRNFLRQIMTGEFASTEYSLRGGNSTQYYVRHTGYPITQNGKVVRIVGAVTNITDEVNFRKQLVKSEERFRLLIETADDFIFALDSYGYFITVNSLGAKGFGYTTDEMKGKHFLEFVDEDSKADVAIAFQKMLSNQELTRFNVRFIDKFGSSLIYEINARNIHTDNGTGGLIGIGREISERIKNEEKLKQLNAKLIEANRIISIEQDRAKQQISVLEELNRLKNEFISNVSHELRTPLASIVGFAETLTSEDDLPPEMRKEFSEIIYNEGRRLARLINDILDFSKLESNKKAMEISSVDVVELAKEIAAKWQNQMKRKGLTFHTEIPDSVIKLTADRERISKAIGNILSNAVKFTASGGRVSLMMRDFPKEVEIIINDTGTGIPKEDIPKLFDKFSKVNRSGTQIPGAGFGLAAVKQIIDLHNGLIKVKSEIDKGSTFIIKLPKK